MKKKLTMLLLSYSLVVSLVACGSSASTSSQDSSSVNSSAESTVDTVDLEDGLYTVDFTTDNSMFHINETLDNKADMTVENKIATVHIILESENIVNLYYGKAEDAQKEGAELIDPVEEEVTYDDGMTETVYAFDVPVPAIDEEFDLALIGTKGKWYDHKVKVSNPVLKDDAEDASEDEAAASDSAVDGNTVEVTLEGGTGRASIDSPASYEEKDGGYIVTIVWSSPNYDYMIVGGEKYLPVNTDGNSTFEIPVSSFDEPLEVTADTTAMSQPHEIDYTITFNK